MVSSYFGNPGNKPDVSTNNKEDIISKNLRDFKTAITIMKRHPEVLNEFVNAVKEDV